MLQLLCCVVLANLYPENADMIAAAKPHIDKVLVSPTSASYEVTNCRRGANEKYWKVRGTVDTKNVYNATIRLKWEMVFTFDFAHDVKPVGIWVIYAGDNLRTAYESEELQQVVHEGMAEQRKQQKAAQEAEQKAAKEAAEKQEKEAQERPKRIWRAYATMIGELEKTTSKLPYNSPKRVRQYWQPLNVKTTRFQETQQVTEDELKDIVQRALAEKWPTDKPTDRAAVATMLRRFQRGR